MEGTRLNSAKTKAFLETYEILEELGSGTGGTVRKAYHKNLEKYVVIKKMHQSVAEVLNKRTETDALKNLRFQYIPQVLDFLELEDGIYTVMDYVPGSSFKSLIQEGRSFTQKQVLKYALELFETLEYIHTRTPKIIHGDIKPENLMLTPDDNICLIDFNISNISDDVAIVEGYTKGYASPEQIQSFEEYSQWMQKNTAVSKLLSDDDGKTELIVNDDEGTLLLSEEEDKTEVIKEPLKEEEKFVPSVRIDERADIYSACATIYYILTGEKPSFSEEKLVEPVKISPKVSEGLNYLIVHGMEWERDKRFKTASDVVNVLNNINKLDKRYKRLILSQNVLFATAVALIALGVIFLNQARLFSERADKQRYDEILEEMEEAAYLSEADRSTLEKLYEESILLDSNRIDAYYTYGTSLYLQKDYEKVIEFIEENVLYNTELSGQEEMDEIYYILGSSYAKENIPDYKMALLYLQKAIDNGNNSSRCYRELAECYLALDDVQNAENILNKAKDEGQLSADMLLLSGQINCIKGEVESAIADYKECILKTNDEEILLRSYLGLNGAYLAEKDEVSLKNAVSIMEEAITHITGNNQAQLLQTQTQNYIDLFNLTGEEKYALSAIETINKAITSGWGDLDNYLNLAFLYEQIDDYDRAKETLLGLLDKYPDNYAVYKRLSFLEADIQSSLPSENRDYKDFDTYYKAAKENFEKQDKVNSDVEMQMLDDMYLDAVNSGWIK